MEEAELAEGVEEPDLLVEPAAAIYPCGISVLTKEGETLNYSKGNERESEYEITWTI